MKILEEEVEKYWRLRMFYLKAKSWTFFSKFKNRCLNIKKMKIVIMRWKPMTWWYFQHLIIMSFKNCVEKFFYLCEKWRSLLTEFEPKTMNFFQKIKIDVHMSQKYFSRNTTHIISIPLNKFWVSWFWVSEPFENPMSRNSTDLGST